MAATRQDNDPRIAVLIPAYNEELVIRGTIEALMAADVNKRDIYVVDDRSTDKTVEIVKSMGVQVHTVDENGGKARAQVEALKHFQLCERYDWLVLLDGDSKVEPYFYNAMYSAAKKDPSVALYVGQVKSAENSHLFSSYRAFEYTFSHDVAKQAQSNFNVVYVSPGCTSMYRTDIIAQLQIDHLTLAEDMDLTMQVQRRGERVVYIAEAGVITQDPDNLKDYNKQVLRWYRGFWQVVLKHNVLSWGPKGRVDLYMWMLIADALFLNRLVWLFGLVAIFPNIWVALALDLGVAGAIAGYCAYRTRRMDVLTKFPIYYWLSFINLYALLRSFIEIMVLRRKILAWNKVRRYEFHDARGMT